MAVSYDPLFVNQEKRRHSPEFKQTDFLIVTIGYPGTKIRTTGEWHSILLPVFPKRIRTIRTNGNNLCPTLDKLRIVLTQLRQMLTTIGSYKSA